MLRGGQRPDNDGRSAKLTGSAQGRLDEWFDTSVFSQPEAFTCGASSRTSPDVRTHRVNNFDFALFKNTSLGSSEMATLQFRVEFFNLFNRTQFDFPGAVFGTEQFGVISSQNNLPRLVQFALRLTF